MGIIVDGKKIAENIKNECIKKVKDDNLKKSLAIFYVGDNPVIDKFISLKKDFGNSVGVEVKVFKYSVDISQDDFIKKIQEESKVYDGVLVQLPLPEDFNVKKVLDSVPEEKDIDVLSESRFEKFSKGDVSFFPPVAGAVAEIFKSYDLDLNNKNIVVVGEGFLVGRPISAWLKTLDLDFVSVNEHTENKEDIYKKADVLISGTGNPASIKKEFLKDGVVLVDVGSSSHKGSIAGDIEISCKDVSSVFSKVPGGVGPITIAILFKNLLYN